MARRAGGRPGARGPLGRRGPLHAAGARPVSAALRRPGPGRGREPRRPDSGPRRTACSRSFQA
eukprot:10335157-Lingulodinium_polyedra.AAC.1